MRPLVLIAALFSAAIARADAPMCATGPANDARLRAIQSRERSGIQANAAPMRTATVRDGAFYLPNDGTFSVGYRPFDLDGQSLVFTPAGGNAYHVRREALRYTEPSGAPARDFHTDSGFSVERSLAFAFPIYGRSVTKIYATAFNSIQFDPPAEETGMQFDAVESLVHRAAVVAPLMVTTRKPSALRDPRVWIDERPGAVVVTWRSTGGTTFGYDVQAELTSAGVITFSYRTVSMRWGTPIVSPGFDPAAIARTSVETEDDPPSGITVLVPAAMRPMVDIRKVEVVTLADSDVFAVRLTLDAPIDPTKLEGDQAFGFLVAMDDDIATVEIDRNKVLVQSFTGMHPEVNGAAAHISGNVVEIYGLRGAPTEFEAYRLEAYSYSREPLNSFVDGIADIVVFLPVKRYTATDFSAFTSAGAQREGLIAEPFVLGAFNPQAVWDNLQQTYGLSDYDYDAVAIYQNFYTDLIFYAGAYATGGNPQVDGVTPRSIRNYGAGLPRSPTLMHMNHLTYDYSDEEKTASQVMLHELGHRWLFYFEIEQGPLDPRSLNPVSAHPAAYVHTPSAFALHGPNEASVMGGAFFTPLGGNSYRATAANWGYSWLDLYAMGLAGDSEVKPWFFLAGTDLPKQYFAEDGVTVTGTRWNVTLNSIYEAIGPREPTPDLSQRNFRVLFVLVTEAAPTEADVATLNRWRSVLERDFFIATGRRGAVTTTFARPPRRRSATLH